MGEHARKVPRRVPRRVPHIVPRGLHGEYTKDNMGAFTGEKSPVFAQRVFHARKIPAKSLAYAQGANTTGKSPRSPPESPRGRLYGRKVSRGLDASVLL